MTTTVSGVSSCKMKTPIGALGLTAGNHGLISVSWRADKGSFSKPNHPVLRAAIRALERYFTTGDDLLEVGLDLSNLPTFHREVLTTLRSEVRYGETVTYGVLAALAGRPGAARAVGNAMNRNPTPLFVPCHRVLAANGIGGFGPGEALKRRLLATEGVTRWSTAVEDLASKLD